MFVGLMAVALLGSVLQLFTIKLEHMLVRWKSRPNPLSLV
jgi:hypothetical protein